MPVNPRSLANLLPMPHLESGVTSEVHRVRAATEVQAWFRSLTAEQRGDVLVRVMAADAPAGAGVGERAPSLPSATPQPAEEHGERLVLGEMPSGKLTPYAARVVAALRDGGTLTRTDGGTWRLTFPDGRSEGLRGDTVQGLRDRRVLVESANEPNLSEPPF